MDDSIAQLIDMIAKLKVNMDDGFERMDKKFEEVDRRFDEVDRRFDEVDKKFEEVDRRFDKIDIKLNKHDYYFEELFKLNGTLRRITGENMRDIEVLKEKVKII